MQTQVDLLNSAEIASQAIDAAGLLDTPAARAMIASQGEAKTRAALVAAFGKRLEVLVRKTSRVVELRYSDASPERARDALNAVIKGYIATANRISTAPAQSRQEQYSAQLQSLRQEMDRIQREATEYQQRYQIVEPNERYDNGSRQIGELSSKLLDAQGLRNRASSEKRALEAMIEAGVPAEEIPEIAQLKGITELKLKLAELEGKIAEMSGVLGPSHPRRRAVMSEKAALRERLDREAQTALNALLNDDQKIGQQVATIRGELSVQEKHLLEMKKHRDVIGSYQRQLESAQRIYDSAAAKYDEILMASSINSPSLAVLRWAVAPDSHARPILRSNLIMSLPAGLLLGLCLAFLLELADRRLRSLEDLQRELALPVLGRAS
ncbi:hypothetical protein, partial [Ideonella sp.]|uniref:hypothetical protein n=1 Tax=Ideonella sp. TaxID=1929293 RepID=UPI003BB71606